MKKNLLLILSLFMPMSYCMAQAVVNYSMNYEAEFTKCFGSIGYNVAWGFDKTYEEVRIMVNDMNVNNSSDFDFNDVVFDAKLTETGARITLRAVGTTSQMRVGGKEVHEQFGVATSTIINTREMMYDAVSFDIEGDLGGDYNKIEVEMQDENGNWLLLQSRKGDAPTKLAVPTSAKWCMENECISVIYPDFIRYVSGDDIKWYENYQGTNTEPTPDDNIVKKDIFEFKLNHDDHTAEVTGIDCKHYLIVIPESIEFDGQSYIVTRIGKNACHDGKYSVDGNSIAIPNTVTAIDAMAFSGADWIWSLFFPSSITKVYSNAFRGPLITRLCINDFSSWCNISFDDEYSNPLSSAHYLYRNDETYTDIVIPEGVTSIPSYTFMGEAFNTISIPSSLTSISQFAFGVCNKLTDIYCYSGAVPATDLEAFDTDNIKNVVLHVPAGSIDAYITAKPWNQFMDIVAIDGSGDNDNPSEDNSSIVGKWKFLWSTPFASYRMTQVEFKDDGTFSYTSADKPDYEEHGVYKIEGDILYQMFSDENDWELSRIKSVDSNYLKLIDLSDDGKEELGELYFLNTNTGGSDATLTGTWLGSYSNKSVNRYEQWVFNPDGTGEMKEWRDDDDIEKTETFTYTVTGTSINIDWGDGSPETYDYSISGVTLTLSRFERSWNYYKQGVISGIHSITIDKGEQEFYSIKGEKLKSPSKGLNIIKMRDGTIRKVVVK